MQSLHNLRHQWCYATGFNLYKRAPLTTPANLNMFKNLHTLKTVMLYATDSILPTLMMYCTVYTPWPTFFSTIFWLLPFSIIIYRFTALTSKMNIVFFLIQIFKVRFERYWMTFFTYCVYWSFKEDYLIHFIGEL